MNRDEIARLKKKAAQESKELGKLSPAEREALRRKQQKDETEKKQKKKGIVKAQKKMEEELTISAENQMKQEFLEKLKLNKEREEALMEQEKMEKEKVRERATERKKLQEERIRQSLAQEEERLSKERTMIDGMTESEKEQYFQALDSSITAAQQELQAQNEKDIEHLSLVEERKQKEKQAKLDLKNAQKAKLVHHQELEEKLGSGYNVEQEVQEEADESAAHEADVLLAHRNNLKAFKRSGDVL